jgi:hypothetical protein
VQDDERGGLEYFHTRNLNQDSLGDTFGAIYWHYGSKNSPVVGQTVKNPKTSIISAFDFRGLQHVGTTLQDNLHSLLRTLDASPNTSTTHSNEIPDDVHNNVHVAEQAELEACADVRAVSWKCSLQHL